MQRGRIVNEIRNDWRGQLRRLYLGRDDQLRRLWERYAQEKKISLEQALMENPSVLCTVLFETKFHARREWTREEDCWISLDISTHKILVLNDMTLKPSQQQTLREGGSSIALWRSHSGSSSVSRRFGQLRRVPVPRAPRGRNCGLAEVVWFREIALDPSTGLPIVVLPSDAERTCRGELCFVSDLVATPVTVVKDPEFVGMNGVATSDDLALVVH